VRKFVLISILPFVLGLMLLVPTSKQTEEQQEYSIEVTGYTWDHLTISVSVFPLETESWWKPAYLNATLHSIAQWNDAIQEFASNHSEFSYLSEIRMVPTVNHENVSGFDIYVGWIEECGSESTIGQSRATVRSSCLTVNNTVCLTAKAPSGHIMTEVDMQNIVLHELGHTLGLYHSSFSGDIMYSIVDYRATVKQPSSLDIYALSQIFGWTANFTQFTSSNMCPQESNITLPSNIAYVHFMISDENLPASVPQNLIEQTIGLFQRPETLAFILIVASLLAVSVIAIKRRKKP